MASKRSAKQINVLYWVDLIIHDALCGRRDDRKWQSQIETNPSITFQLFGYALNCRLLYFYGFLHDIQAYALLPMYFLFLGLCAPLTVDHIALLHAKNDHTLWKPCCCWSNARKQSIYCIHLYQHVLLNYSELICGVHLCKILTIHSTNNDYSTNNS